MPPIPDTIIPGNRIKQTLHDGGSVIGTMLVEIRQPSVMQLLANAGFDFVLIDTEHGPFNIETVADLSRAARQLGITPIVRIPEITYTAVTQPLDAGAQGIMIPRVTDVHQVREALGMMKYAPIGRRGSVLSRGHTGFKSGPVDSAMNQANEESMLVVQIETAQILERLDEILSVPGIDAALIGPNDLSIALGVPGKMNDQKLVAAIEKSMEACNRHNVVAAIHMNELPLAVEWARRGMRMVSFNSEAGLLMKSGQESVTAIRAMKRQPAENNGS